MRSVLFSIIIFIIVFILFFKIPGIENPDKEIDEGIITALDNFPADLDYVSEFARAKSLNTKDFLTETSLNNYIKKNSLKIDLMRYWNSRNEKYLTATALGTDGKHHIVNSFLKGYSPFYTDEPYVPLYTIAKRKIYKYDHIQYGGKKDVWQNSHEAFKNIYGDCEDHSIILCDWLIEMGYDARIVIGKYKNSGHAWVVVFDKEKIFLLEATSKRKESDFHKMPIASLMKNYHPRFMFNNKYFWFNSGSTLTTDYKSLKWIKKSIYYSI